MIVTIKIKTTKQHFVKHLQPKLMDLGVVFDEIDEEPKIKGKLETITEQNDNGMQLEIKGLELTH